MKQFANCPLSFLLDVTYAIERWNYDGNIKDLVIPVASLTEMVNRQWVHTSVRFQDSDVELALLELRAMETLDFGWFDVANIRVHHMPTRPTDELRDKTFYGLYGMYHAPAPFELVDKVYKHLEPGVTTIAQLSHDFHLSHTGVLIVLRALQMMDAIAYTRNGDEVTLTTVYVNDLSHPRYCEMFNVDPEY